MTLDHYVPQVHLKKWLSSELGLLRAIRKSDLKSFTPKPKGVCAIQDGSTNHYLVDSRAIESFLLEFEPRYNDAVANVSQGLIDNESIHTIAGLVSCISSCSPTAARLHSPFLKELIKSTSNILDRKGLLPKLKGVGVPELLENGYADIKIDGKYPQASGIQNIENTTSTLANCEWDIIRNKFEQSPFFTSDYPIALEPSKQYENINNKIIPLTPEIAVRIKPNPSLKNARNVPKVKSQLYNANQEEVAKINRLIVRSAEDLVFYRDPHNWVINFVERNRHYRIEGVVHKNSLGRKHAIVSKQQIVAFNHGTTKSEPPHGNHWFEMVAIGDA